MAVKMFDTIRLDNDLTSNLPTNEYNVLFEGYEDVYAAAVITERGLTGRLLVHRQMEGGVPVKWEDHQYRILLTRAQKDTLIAHLGMIMYFMALYRDEDPAGCAAYRDVVLLKAMVGVTHIDPNQQWWTATVYLESASGLTVD